MTDERDDKWELEHLYALFYGELGMCGCGNPADGYTLILGLLDHTHQRGDWDAYQQLIGTSGAVQIVLSQLDRSGLTEHGSSVYTSWLTDKGKYARWLMHRHPHEDELDEVGFPHDGQDCDKACWVAPAGTVFDPEPPQPSMSEMVAKVQQEAEAARAKMSPEQRAFMDFADRRVENMLLFGTPDPPGDAAAYTGFSGLLDAAGQADPYGALDALRQRFTGASEPFTPQGFPPPRVALPVGEEDRLPSRGRNTRIGCERYDSGTIIHGRPHTCAKWERGH